MEHIASHIKAAIEYPMERRVALKGNPYANGSGFCGTKARSGAPCKNRPMKHGNCHLHGGISLKGLAYPNLKHGGFSKSLPARMVQRYQEVVNNDPDHLLLVEEIAAMDALAQEAAKDLDRGSRGGCGMS